MREMYDVKKSLERPTDEKLLRWCGHVGCTGEERSVKIYDSGFEGPRRGGRSEERDEEEELVNC